MLLQLDEKDFEDIQSAISKRQQWRMMPESESGVAGAVVAEICRGWMELHDKKPDRDEGEDWKQC